MTGGPWSHCPIPARFPDVETEAYREVTCPRVNRGGAREGQGSGHCRGGRWQGRGHNLALERGVGISGQDRANRMLGRAVLQS